MTAYPKLPTLEPQRTDESAREFGLRAFAFLVREECSACLLDSPALELAIAQSATVIAARDLSDVTRERFHGIRLDILQTLDRRRREVAAAEMAARQNARNLPTPDQARDQRRGRDGGVASALRRPRPIIPPSGASVSTRPAFQPL